MRIMRLVWLGVALMCSGLLASAHAQDNELQKVLVDGQRPGEAKLNLAYLKAERDGLEKVVARLNEYQQLRLVAIEDRSRELFHREAGNDLETTQALLRNSRMELQKLTWDEAAESAMLEEMEKDQQNVKLTRQAMMEAEMRGRMEIAKRELSAQQQKLASINRENHTRSDVADQLVKVDRAQAEMEVLANQLAKVAEITKAESESPLTESKRRLAQIRVRRKLMEKEIEDLNGKLPQLREMAAEQRRLERDRKALEAMETRITPLQLRQLELEALISVLEGRINAGKSEEGK